MAAGENRAREKNDDDGASVQITRLRSSRKLRCGLHRASAMPKTATTAPGSKPKIAGDELASAVTVHRNYRIAIRRNSQIFITTQKSLKTKVVQNQKFYHFAFETIPKFGLHFEMNF